MEIWNYFLKADIMHSLEPFIRESSTASKAFVHAAIMGKEEEAQLKGLSKVFNSVTVNGRANVAKATYASVALLVTWMVFKPKISIPADIPTPWSTPEKPPRRGNRSRPC